MLIIAHSASAVERSPLCSWIVSRWLQTCSAAALGSAVAAVEGICSCWENFGGPVGGSGIWLIMLAWYLSMYPQSWDCHMGSVGGLVLFKIVGADCHRSTDLGEDEKVGAELGWKDPACEKDGGVTSVGCSLSLSCMATSSIQLIAARASLNFRLDKFTSILLT